LLLVLALSVPLVASVGYEIYGQMQQAVAHAKSSLRSLAQTMASNTGGKIANARQTLERLAQRPLVQQVDPQHCDPVLKDLLELNPDFANVNYANKDGVVVCSAVPQPGGKLTSVAQTQWFKAVRQDQRFTIGEPFVGLITGKWVSVLSTPIWNAQHEMVGSVQFPLDLKAYDPNIPAQQLPEGSRYGFFKQNGIMVWRNLDPEGVIGTRPNAEAARRIVEVRDGEFESLAVDGIVRFFSVVPMPEVGWVAFVGVPASQVYAAAKQRAITTAAIALVAITALVFLAVALARRIATPMGLLAETARSIQIGNRGARAIPSGPSEVAQMAAAFNAMTDSLQATAVALEAEITERKQMEGQVRQLAFFDALTKLPNRLLLHDRLGQAMAASTRDTCYGAVLFLDLDNFKPLNDAHGHEVGDSLLVEAANRLKSCMRAVDTVARFGGDEFVVVLSQLDTDAQVSRAQAQAIAEKISTLLAEPYTLSVRQAGLPDGIVEHRCTASVGVALFINHATSQTDILKRADAAMYQAKKAGRNAICFSDAAE
jgi:diguanylate cyclase (GGDEF)-like protein